MGVHAQLLVPGLPPGDQQTIGERLCVVQGYLARWLPADHAWHRADAHGQRHGDLRHWFHAFERTITQVDSLAHDPPDRVRFRTGQQDWYQTYLVPLAQELGLIAQAEATLLQTCWRTGAFDLPTSTTGKRVRPAFATLLPEVRAVLHEAPFTTSTSPDTSRVAQLHARGLCHNRMTARQVATAVRQDAIDQCAAGLARGVLLAFFQHGPVGLLHSSCPYRNALFLIERHKQSFSPDTLPPESVWAAVRADVIALYQAASQVHPKLWNERLLHEPLHSATRQHHQRTHLWPNQRERVVWAIQQHRACAADEASRLLDILVQAGLPGLLDWRGSIAAHHVRQTLAQRRVQRALDHHLSVLAADDRQAIAALLDHLVTAMHEAQVALPLAMLLNDDPSSQRRRRLGRRVWFGLPAIMQRRQQRRQRRHHSQRRRARPPRRATARPHPRDTAADRLVTAFAAHAGLDRADARARLRDFITYGLLGLLPRAARAAAIYQPLVSWLALIKWGRLPGSVPWQRVVTQVNSYREHLGLPGSFSPQLTRSIVNQIAKPAYWHGGQGEAVARVRQRATLHVDQIPRLHATWVLVPVQMPLVRRDASTQLWHGMLVFDRGSELLVGCCFSAHPPGMREVQLALYEAIWHPAAPAWPLHGIPECIQLPQALAAEGLHDLEQTATFLLAAIDTQRKQPWLGLQAVRKVVKNVRKRGGNAVRQALGDREDFQAGQIIRVILHWLKATSFPDHTEARVPHTIRKHGVAMPGFDTPAAGWLLPVTGDGETGTDAVWYQGARYTSPWFPTDAGQSVRCRTYPFFMPIAEPDIDQAQERGLFIEVVHQGQPHLWYVTRTA